MEKLKSWEELGLVDDYMFKLVMKNKRICKHLLEEILGVEIGDVKYIEEEKSLRHRFKGTANDVSPEVKALLDYIDGHVSDDVFVQEIDREIRELKKLELERKSYMTIKMKTKEARDAAFAEGEKKGEKTKIV